MAHDPDRYWQYFTGLHRAMPQQAPGNRACTLRALSYVPGTPSSVLDLGCGPGRHTLELAAALPAASFTGIDASGVLLAEARVRAAREAPGRDLTFVEGDMLALGDRRVDLIWSEGAAYIVGVNTALACWREHLNPGGCVAFTDAVWLKPDVPGEVSDFWQDYPDMQSIHDRQSQAVAQGFTAIANFVLPPETWADYYEPLQARIDELRPGRDETETAVLDAAQREIDLYRNHSDCYSYAFFILQRT